MLLDAWTAQVFLFLGRRLFVAAASLWQPMRRVRRRYRARDGRCVGAETMPLERVDSVERFFEQVAVTNLLWYYPTYGKELRERSLLCYIRKQYASNQITAEEDRK